VRAGKHELTATRLLSVALVCLLASTVVALCCVFFGPVMIEPGRVLRLLAGSRPPGSEVEAEIVFGQRLPRIAMAFLAGGSLAVAGATFQALLRNPLATPHTLGITAGGSLGAVAAISFGIDRAMLGMLTPVQLAALAGSGCVMAVIYGLAQQRERISTLKLLLAGVTLGLMCSALIMFVRYLADPHKLVVLDRWLMGGLDVHRYRSLASVLPLCVPALALIFSQATNLNQVAFGEELAAGRGVNVRGVQIAAFVGASVLTASVVSVAGPIGFVGLIVPHAVRLALGPDQRLLLTTCLFAGGAFLAVADTFARTVFAPTELPVGVLTAMLGGPFFLLLLVKKGGL